MKRLEAAVLPGEPEPFGEADFAAHPALVKGYVGPGVLGEGSATGIRYLVDPRVVTGTRWVTGADEPGHHVVGLVAGRDFEADGVIDVADVRAGDPCPACGAPLEIARGVEIGHIFQLGRKYAEALGLHGARARRQAGDGHDGLLRHRRLAGRRRDRRDHPRRARPVLAREVAPADVHVVIAGKPGGEQWPAAESLAADLEAAGVRVLLDDRDSVSPGVKFKDAELLGIPTIVVVGRGLADGVVEVEDRRTGERTDVPLADAVDPPHRSLLH